MTHLDRKQNLREAFFTLVISYLSISRVVGLRSEGIFCIYRRLKGPEFEAISPNPSLHSQVPIGRSVSPWTVIWEVDIEIEMLTF